MAPTWNIGSFRSCAQSRQRDPTGVWIKQRGQIGFSQRPQRRYVSTLGSAAHRHGPTG
jgi:hypothetical protein